MDMRLPPATAQLWNFVETLPMLRDFVLIGDTALSMPLEHRLSEDLDFVTTQNNLPRTQLDLLQRIAAEHGHRMVRNDDDLAYDEFSDAGRGLHDYQQDLW